MNKIILCDCDGVLLNWQGAFDEWMLYKLAYRVKNPGEKYITKRFDIDSDTATHLMTRFNETARVGFLPPFRNAVRYVRAIHEEMGYAFRVITSVSNDPYVVRLREQNLKSLFGTAIDTITCLPTGSSKVEALHHYQGSGMLWIEDSKTNAKVGTSKGLKSFLMRHNPKFAEDCGDYVCVDDWEAIFHHLKVKEYKSMIEEKNTL